MIRRYKDCSLIVSTDLLENFEKKKDITVNTEKITPVTYAFILDIIKNGLKLDFSEGMKHCPNTVAAKRNEYDQL